MTSTPPSTAHAIAAAIRAGTTTAREQALAAIARIEALDPAINAIPVRDFDRALAAADAADARLAAGDTAPLLGVPMTVKEAFDIAGLPTHWGFAQHRDNIAVTDALAVQRLKAAGAVILGKSNVPKGLGDWQSVNSIHGRTSHPLDPTRTPGGSSGGGAAAVAAGMVPIELGSDIGGSIRVPAHFCGVWGHKPSWNAISTYGHRYPGTDGAETVLGVIGPIARDPQDLARLVDLLTTLPLPRPQTPPKRVLVLTEHPEARTAHAVVEGVERAATALERVGVEVVRSSDLLPDLARQHAGYGDLLGVTFARSDPSLHATLPSLLKWLSMLDAQARNTRAWGALFAEFDAVIAPPAASQAFAHDHSPLADRTLDIDGTTAPYDAHLAWAGLATYPGLPVTCMPVGLAGGLPTGVQVIADLHQDHRAIEVAALIHQQLEASA
ncbi:amidase family protein [Sphingomonas qomolangmaensis]|uniref:Amidase family protein n=1 Tax=Sphingomonas qomolangmaensis TaxID=2918765 RepID=A0ABY5LCJ5_9SPHN|nr:amidase family protein [Sphingomonas qomolangmaensis]UUL83552.1 amidase family protein [Sphingomonas qomolangmaensis]